MGQHSIPVTAFRSDCFPGTEQFAAWRERIGVIFSVAPASAQASRGFDAQAQAFHLGELILARTRFDAQRFVRSQRQARSDLIDHYLVQLYQRGGYVGDVGGRQVQVEAGDVSILDLSRPLSTAAPPAQCLSLVVPRDVMEILLNHATPDLHGTVLRSGSAQLFGSYLSSLDEQLADMELSQAPRIARATGELLAACLLPTMDHLQRAQPQVQAVRLQQVRQYIDTQLGSPELSPAQICWALHVSRSHLYRMFETSGGVRKYIQTRRLMRIHAALADPDQNCSIMSLGERFGFVSHAHLSRAFREHFGYNPSEVRDQPQLSVRSRSGQGSESAGAGREGFDVWLRELRN